MTIQEINQSGIGFPGDCAFKVHSATLCQTDGQRICAFFAGPFEGSPDTKIYGSFSIDEEWSSPIPIADVGPEPHWNPVLHWDGQQVWLFFKVGIYPKRWRTMVSVQDRSGTWSKPKELVPGDLGGRGPVKNKMITLFNGDWLAPASLEQDSGWTCFVDRSFDRGKSWRAGKPLSINKNGKRGAGIIQPSLWESRTGHVHMLCRSDLSFIYRADSYDFGDAWTVAEPTTIPNNNRGLDLLALFDRLILACNPISDPHAPRSPLTLFESRDNGETWQELLVLEDSPGEFSYPAIIKTKRGFTVAYTNQRNSIKIREFSQN